MGTKYSFPKAIKADCHGCLNNAKSVCKQVGISTAERSGSVTVKTRPGEKKNKNGWSWKQDGQQVMMITDEVPYRSKKHVITIATDPKDATKGWSRDALTHEMCHPFLERNHGEYGHQGEYGRRLNGKVFGWHKGTR